MVARKVIVALASIALAAACSKDAAKKKDDGGDKDGANANENGGEDANKRGTTPPEDDGLDGIYTGFDGKTDYSLLLPGFRTYEIEDTSVAKVETVEVQLSQATIDELVAEAKKKMPNLDEEKIKKRFGRKRTIQKIVPLKAGWTYVKSKRGKRPGGGDGKPQGAGLVDEGSGSGTGSGSDTGSGSTAGTGSTAGNGSGGGGGGGGRDGWTKTEKMKLIISAYTPEVLEAGKHRYTTDGNGNLRACKSCHETGDEGAPPHELGRIMDISDKDAVTWITTGVLEDRKAKIQHTWEFSSDDEEKGVVAYLRSKQSKDVETLTKLEFENFRQGGFN